MKDNPVTVFWFRRDLRLEDNCGLFSALNEGRSVLPLFIFDRDILDELEDPADPRVSFIHASLSVIHETLTTLGSGLCVFHGRPVVVFKRLIETHAVSKVVANHDYEPYAEKRDRDVAALLRGRGISFETYKDQVVYEKREVVKSDGEPYTIYTAFKNKWRGRLKDETLPEFECEPLYHRFVKTQPQVLPSLEELGFQEATIPFPPPKLDHDTVRQYSEQRDLPAVDGTTRLGVHLRFGTLSIRSLVGAAERLNDTWLDELIWREFYMMILANFPHVVGQPFKPQYRNIRWRDNTDEFEQWCEGQTGFPIVDAGMRQLNQTGFMHNRVRMITASFLTKDLLIDWRWGEAYFAKKLLDFELASNNGNWQWAAGTGCDAAPYFRIFNPQRQLEKFDPDKKYVRRWVPEVESSRYAAPMVDHAESRKRTLEAYKTAVESFRE